ncbi:serine aminopeptidase, s33 domain-containing protein [Hirsutella rhossiliensis]|uniref:Serine aminopeptidase, s33 domain-containing protein n=1 Tax=Hirsutella rhossiliensis TaxID=111463 RepID=A0A9P8SLX3_9HYPO|nr:serine aminopeptidase, s33 domain-containing protein [Hirsutella rhossiliensis]KAH0967968.1 serine aminopeptidase, s33 domain-containing protein [Hirsutella rhossiliensis]
MATPGPRAVKTTEGVLTTADGQALYTKAWEPPPDAAKALLVWLHGFSDHCNTFGDFFEALASHGIAVHSLDQRGWGRSVARQSDKGLTGPTETVLSDMTDFVRALPQTDLPLFLGGHSMGGAQALLWAARGPAKTRLAVRGYVVAAPFLRFHPSMAPPRVIVWLARVLARWLPNQQLYNKPRLERLCRDGGVRRAMADDPLLHNLGTLHGVADMMRRGDEIADGLHDLPAAEDEATSLWIGHGSGDRIVCPDAVRDYFARSRVEDKHLRTYEGCYHNLHQEPGRHKADFASDVVAWISERA